MTTLNIPFKRGTTAQNDGYRGIEGEITLDTDKRTIRVHDGLIFGGEELLRKSDLQEFLSNIPTFDHRHSVSSPTVVYKARATPGSAENAAVWSIQKITITYGASTTYQTTWANGSNSFLHKWSDRALYNYSAID